jgi:hypothetical protein
VLGDTEPQNHKTDGDECNWRSSFSARIPASLLEKPNCPAGSLLIFRGGINDRRRKNSRLQRSLE